MLVVAVPVLHRQEATFKAALERHERQALVQPSRVVESPAEAEPAAQDQAVGRLGRTGICQADVGIQRDRVAIGIVGVAGDLRLVGLRRRQLHARAACGD